MPRITNNIGMDYFKKKKDEEEKKEQSSSLASKITEFRSKNFPKLSEEDKEDEDIMGRRPAYFQRLRESLKNR